MPRAGDAGELRDRLRMLPGVDRILGRLGGAPHALAAAVARRAVEEARAGVLAGGDPPPLDALAARARELIAEHERDLLRPVLNATGVLIHTNLGRTPLGAEQLDAVAAVAGGYSNLEYDLERGARSSRYVHAARLISLVTGAEAAVVTNNNAAALLLVLAALCRDGEVVISRGELIEIGGEFRIPEVMEASGARLVEIGTTNRTHLRDYERALSADTAALLRVHPSNYRVVGFTASVPARDLARLAHTRGVLFLSDLGSGLLAAASAPAEMAAEPPVEAALAEGADLVTFSGDKLLGGPQAGVVAGRADLVASLCRHPLLRAMRPDKMTLAALEATMRAYLEDRAERLPLWRMALAAPEELEVRARSLAARLDEELAPRGLKVEATPTRAVTGGGSLPGADLGSWGVALTHPEVSSDHIAHALRRAATPVIGRIEDARLLLDLRTIPPEEDALLGASVEAALA